MFHFVPNLKDYLYHPGRGNDRFDCYLQSVDYADNQVDLVQRAAHNRCLIAADNGNVDLIGDLIRQFSARAEQLADHRKAEEHVLGHYARPGQLSADLMQTFQACVYDIRQASFDAVDPHHISTVVEQQEAIRGSYLIGMEDFTLAVMTALSIEPEYTQFPESFYRELIEREIQFALDTRKGVYGEVQGTVFAGIHAVDFDTACLAGSMVGASGVDGIATGLVGALKDRNYFDFRVRRGEVVPFGFNAPRPYIRTMELVCGLLDGHVQTSGKLPRFHALGLGTPILLPMLAYVSSPGTYLCSDSTAPIADGWISSTISLYVDKPAPIKLKSYKIAQYWLEDGIGWDCPCPFCRKAMEAYPVNLPEARAWWKGNGSPNLTSRDMLGDSPLTTWLPYLSYPADTEMRTAISIARVRHNHWILQRIEKEARRASSDPLRQEDWASSLIQAYLETTATNQSWKRAVEIAWAIACETKNHIQGAGDSGHLQPHPLC